MPSSAERHSRVSISPGLMAKLGAEEAESRTKAEVIDLLKRNGETWAQFLEGASEEFLAESVQMPAGATPPAKSRFEILLSVKEHEMHHRGQLMLIERMIAIVPHLTRQMQGANGTGGESVVIEAHLIILARTRLQPNKGSTPRRPSPTEFTRKERSVIQEHGRPFGYNDICVPCPTTGNHTP